MRDQRVTRKRFRLSLPVAISWASGHARHTVHGVVVEIGSDAVLVACVEEPPARSILSVSIEWPVRLEDGCHLRLVVTGRLLDVRDALLELTIDRYEFRTAPRGEHETAAPGDVAFDRIIPFPALVS